MEEKHYAESLQGGGIISTEGTIFSFPHTPLSLALGARSSLLSPTHPTSQTDLSIRSSFSLPNSRDYVRGKFFSPSPAATPDV